MGESPKEYNSMGIRLLNLGRYEEAIDFFTKAIEKDPTFANAYRGRGEALLLLDRIVEGNTDIQRAKDIQAGKHKPRKKTKTKKKAKLNIHEIENIYDMVFPAGPDEGDDDLATTCDSPYDSVFTDDPMEDSAVPQAAAGGPQAADALSALLEYIDGKQVEASGVILFKPSTDAIAVVRDDNELTVPLERLACIRMAGVPGNSSSKEKNAGRLEIIEMVDGTIYHELIHPEQDLENFLLGFSTKKQTRFPCTLIPRVNIKSRCQQRMLGEILLEKRYIASDILKQALDEFHSARNMKIGRIIARKAHILHSAVEEELARARRNRVTGLKTGEILLASGLVNEQQILAALEYQEDMRKLRIGQFLVRKGIVQEKEVYASLAEKHGFPFIDLRTRKIPRKVLLSLPRDLVREHEIIPVALRNGRLVVATHDVELDNLCEKILKAAKCRQVQFVLTQPTLIKTVIGRLFAESPAQ